LLFRSRIDYPGLGLEILDYVFDLKP